MPYSNTNPPRIVALAALCAARVACAESTATDSRELERAQADAREMVGAFFAASAAGQPDSQTGMQTDAPADASQSRDMSEPDDAGGAAGVPPDAPAGGPEWGIRFAFTLLFPK